MNSEDVEYDITYDRSHRAHKVIVDSGDHCFVLSKSQLLEMLKDLEEADSSL